MTEAKHVETPRTDAVIEYPFMEDRLQRYGTAMVLADFARQLERELAEVRGENEVLREQNAALNQENVAMERDLEAARGERDEARSLHARLANSTGYLVDRIKRLEALVREMAREGGQAPTAEKEIARIAAETRTQQEGEEQ
jgi:predicted  nucleic acid-binding Zn-ribbon protein